MDHSAAYMGFGLAIFLLLGGCFSGTAGPKEKPHTSFGESGHAAASDAFLVRCRIVDEERRPLPQATCHFEFDALVVSLIVDQDGFASQTLPNGSIGQLRGTADGRETKTVGIVVDAPKTVEMALTRQTSTSPAASPGGSPSPRPSSSPSPSPPPSGSPPPPSSTGSPAAQPIAPLPPPIRRTWLSPVTVTTGGNEPHLAIDSQGTIYYSPLNEVYRSEDGGTTWTKVSPGPTEAHPVSASDTSVSVAPDDSLWFARTSFYVGNTIGCTSTNKGRSWTCDNLAMPGITDRMWIVGLDAKTGYLQTNLGLYLHVWARTDTGSQKYVPYGTTTDTIQPRNGNMVYDAVHKAVWQVEWTNNVGFFRVDGQTGLIRRIPTSIPAPYALPWVSTSDGVLWTTGEPVKSDGSRGLVMARSVDQGKTWKQFPIPTAAKSVTFSYIASGPGGRAAAVYYGSDKAGASTNNGGAWSLYVLETSNGLDANPTWVESQVVPLVHTGSICIGLSCQDFGGDPYARYSGDLIGVAIDGQGNAHVAYVEDTVDHKVRNQYVRQVLGG